MLTEKQRKHLDKLLAMLHEADVLNYLRIQQHKKEMQERFALGEALEEVFEFTASDDDTSLAPVTEDKTRWFDLKEMFKNDEETKFFSQVILSLNQALINTATQVNNTIVLAAQSQKIQSSSVQPLQKVVTHMVEGQGQGVEGLLTTMHHVISAGEPVVKTHPMMQEIHEDYHENVRAAHSEFKQCRENASSLEDQYQALHKTVAIIRFLLNASIVLGPEPVKTCPKEDVLFVSQLFGTRLAQNASESLSSFSNLQKQRIYSELYAGAYSPTCWTSPRMTGDRRGPRDEDQQNWAPRRIEVL